MTNLFRTKNDLPERTRAEVVALLNQRLADAIDLQSQCKQAHWNVKGDTFIALHELFDKINEDVEDYVDLIAERSVQLGGTAEGTVRMVAKRSLLSEYAPPSAIAKDHVEALSHALATFGDSSVESRLTLVDTVHRFLKSRPWTKMSRKPGIRLCLSPQILRTRSSVPGTRGFNRRFQRTCATIARSFDRKTSSQSLPTPENCAISRGWNSESSWPSCRSGWPCTKS